MLNFPQKGTKTSGLTTQKGTKGSKTSGITSQSPMSLLRSRLGLTTQQMPRMSTPRLPGQPGMSTQIRYMPKMCSYTYNTFQ
jgi:hypothetical protein